MVKASNVLLSWFKHRNHHDNPNTETSLVIYFLVSGDMIGSGPGAGPVITKLEMWTQIC